MERYQFVVKETPQGKAHHNDPPPNRYTDRRLEATGKGIAIGVVRPFDVVENYMGGFGYFTWTVDAPSIKEVIALIKECERHGFVELYWGPTRVLDDKDLAEMEGFAVTMRAMDKPRK